MLKTAIWRRLCEAIIDTIIDTGAIRPYSDCMSKLIVKLLVPVTIRFWGNDLVDQIPAFTEVVADKFVAETMWRQGTGRPVGSTAFREVIMNRVDIGFKP